MSKAAELIESVINEVDESNIKSFAHMTRGRLQSEAAGTMTFVFPNNAIASKFARTLPLTVPTWSATAQGKIVVVEKL